VSTPTAIRSHSADTAVATQPVRREDQHRVLSALQLLQTAVTALAAGDTDKAEKDLAQLNQLQPASSWLTNGAHWLHDEIENHRLPSRAGRPPVRRLHRRGATPTDHITEAHGLSDREHEVLALVARGLNSRQIGRELYISASTVSFHLGNIYAKTGVTSRQQLTDMIWHRHLRSA
jgi:DNA-binding CsgD family transcriptional regulator